VVNLQNVRYSEGGGGEMSFVTAVKKFYIDSDYYDYDDVATHFVGPETFFHRSRRNAVLSVIKKFSTGSPYMDAGCGTGLILRYLPANSIGVDISPLHLKRTREKLPETMLIMADIENLPIRKGSCSTVVCTETLEHLPSPRRAVEQIRYVLRKAGVFIGSIPHRFFLWYFKFLSFTCDHTVPFHREYSVREVRNLLREFDIMMIKPCALMLTVVFAARFNGGRVC
jgi:SAM-dependent methyltransferase